MSSNWSAQRGNNSDSTCCWPYLHSWPHHSSLRIHPAPHVPLPESHPSSKIGEMLQVSNHRGLPAREAHCRQLGDAVALWRGHGSCRGRITPQRRRSRRCGSESMMAKPGLGHVCSAHTSSPAVAPCGASSRRHDDGPLLFVNERFRRATCSASATPPERGRPYLLKATRCGDGK